MESIKIVSDEGMLTVDMSDYRNDHKLDEIVQGLLKSDENVGLVF